MSSFSLGSGLKGYSFAFTEDATSPNLVDVTAAKGGLSIGFHFDAGSAANAASIVSEAGSILAKTATKSSSSYSFSHGSIVVAAKGPIDTLTVHGPGSSVGSWTFNLHNPVAATLVADLLPGVLKNDHDFHPVMGSYNHGVTTINFGKFDTVPTGEVAMLLGNNGNNLLFSEYCATKNGTHSANDLFVLANPHSIGHNLMNLGVIGANNGLPGCEVKIVNAGTSSSGLPLINQHVTQVEVVVHATGQVLQTVDLVGVNHATDSLSHGLHVIKF